MEKLTTDDAGGMGLNVDAAPAADIAPNGDTFVKCKLA
jgi:hypothetical protein